MEALAYLLPFSGQIIARIISVIRVLRDYPDNRSRHLVTARRPELSQRRHLLRSQRTNSRSPIRNRPRPALGWADDVGDGL